MIAIIQYNAGNVESVANAVRRLGYEVIVTADPKVLRQVDKVIFPGVGEASSAMRYLQQTGLDVVIKGLTQPVLGICLGMQLMCLHSEEGHTPGLGIFPTRVKQFPPEDLVPHMGWNTCQWNPSPLAEGIEPMADWYFVHSYYAELCSATVAQTDYITPFSAVLQQGNFYATQFHPEKSGAVGAQLLAHFLAI